MLDQSPASFSVGINNIWASTSFSNFRDVKSDKCDLKSGSFLNGTTVSTFNAPVCGQTTYEALVASNSNPLTNVFGGLNVIITQTAALEWSLQVRTSSTLLTGVHTVIIIGTLNGHTMLSDPFDITVVNPCNPYNCSSTVCYSFPIGLLPQNI